MIMNVENSESMPMTIKITETTVTLVGRAFMADPPKECKRMEPGRLATAQSWRAFPVEQL
jgi:hypothetical protein